VDPRQLLRLFLSGRKKQLGFHEMAKSFAQNLRFLRKFFWRTFALFLRMKRNEFCAVLRYFFGAIWAKPEIFFAKVAHETKF